MISNSSPTPDGPETTGNVTREEADQLRLANYYLRVALDLVEDGVILLDAGPLDATGPKILYCNSKATNMVGLGGDRTLRGLHALDLAGSEKDGVALLMGFNEAIAKGIADVAVGVQRSDGGGPLPCTWRIKALTNSLKHVLNFTVTMRPVPSAAKVAPETEPTAPKVDDSDAQSERLRVENLAAMAQGIAHDVNNLLGPITAQLSLVQPKVDPSSEVGQALDVMMASVQRARQFTSQVVKVAKSKPTGRMPSRLHELIYETVRLAQSGSNVKVAVRVPENLPAAMCDSVKISQVLQNLIMNGIQAMPKGGHMDVEAREVEVRHGMDAELKPGRYVEMRVRDRGMGISRDNMAKLFKEAFTTKAEGSGIGLTSCKLIIESHEGVIRVDSAVGVGTEFRFYLPVAAEGAVIPKPADSKPVSKPLVNGAGTVMVVDDLVPIRSIACAILKQCGYKFMEAATGEDAVKQYIMMRRAGTPIDVVVMDLTLAGGMEGLEAAQRIWKEDPGAKIIVSSGSVTDDVQRSFLDQGFVAVLPKPYEAGDLAHVVKHAIQLKRSLSA
jgi:signal transduction histidine kinase/ActR/RegA family two-component response regulator